MRFESDTSLSHVIGANIKHYREQARLTQMQLAEQAGISISYLSKIEAAGCDKSLSISALNQIANALGIEIIQFFKEVSTNSQSAFAYCSHKIDASQFIRTCLLLFAIEADLIWLKTLNYFYLSLELTLIALTPSSPE